MGLAYLYLFLTLIDMSGIEEQFVERIYKEDIWLTNIAQSHELFCDCQNWKKHLEGLLRDTETPWPMHTRQEGSGECQEEGDGGEEVATEEDIPDADMLEALEGIEGGGAGDQRYESSLRYSLSFSVGVLSEEFSCLWH
nr:MAG: ORF2 [Anelloviridae sp.]